MFEKGLFTADGRSGCPYANAQTKQQKAVDADIRPNTQTVIADGALLVVTLLW